MSAAPSFFVIGGTLRPDALCYVERQADHELHDGLGRGEFCYVLTPRQMGKSSLMVRTVVRLRGQGVRVAVLDLTSVGQNLTAEQWYDGLMSRLGQQFGLEEELVTYWRTHDRWGPLQRWLSALEHVVLTRLSGPVVIFIDEIDTVRSLAFSTDEFFAAIRECYNRRSQDPKFERIAFGLLGVASPTDLIRDVRLTPFNIGRRIVLHDFTQAECHGLATGFGVDTALGQQLLARVLHWTGGQPYLTQRLCRAVADAIHTPTSEDKPSPQRPPALPTPPVVDEICHQLFLVHGARERDDNLIFVRERLLRSDVDLAALLLLYASIRKGKPVADNERDPLVSVLKLSGLVRAHRGHLHVRNRIYEAAFNEAWIHTNMPEAEVRRQRVAFRRGALLTVASMIVLLGLALALGLNSLRLRPLGLKATMPDGTVLTLDTVSLGQQHHYEPGRFRTAWLLPTFTSANAERPRLRFLGIDLGRGKPSFDTQTPSDALVFWLTRQDPNTGAYLNFDWWSHFELLDNHGCRFFGSQRAVRHPQLTTGGYSEAPTLPVAPPEAEFIAASGAAACFPRRDPTIQLRLYDLDHQPMADFILPNPAYRRHSAWRPEPLPQTRRDRDLALTLTDVTRTLASYPWNDAPVELPIIRAGWHVFWQGETSTEWDPTALFLSDATGNALSLLPLRPEAGLCPKEAAWKLSATFYRRAEARFTPEETWGLRQLSLPKPGEVNRMVRTTRLSSVDLELTAVVGPGRYLIRESQLVPQATPPSELAVLGDGWFLLPRQRTIFNPLNPSTIAAGRPFLVFRLPPNEPLLRLALFATTANGKSVAAQEHALEGLRFLVLPSAAGESLQDVRICLNRPKRFEFLIAPPAPVRTNLTFELAAGGVSLSQRIPARDPATPPNLIDLTAHYNAALTEDWHQQVPGNDLSRLPRGIQRLGGVDFDIRGIVQLGSTEPPAQRFPRQVSHIRVDRTCRSLHFLHGAGWNAARGTYLGQYLVRYADGSIETIPLVFGRNIHDWWFTPDRPAELPEATPVWTGANPASLSLGYATRLYKFTWLNPRPGSKIESIDFSSSMSASAPFIIAITAE